MLLHFFSIGLIMLLGAMSPGPDFALVAKNTLLHSRKAGLYSALGIACSILVHITYCSLGLATVILHSAIAFTLIKYIGAAYLVYLGIRALLDKSTKALSTDDAPKQRQAMSAFTAFRQGVLCNLLNPKVILFYLALFTVVITPQTTAVWMVLYAIEIFCITLGWFATLAWLLSHPRVLRKFSAATPILGKVFGGFLIAFGVLLTFAQQR